MQYSETDPKLTELLYQMQKTRLAAPDQIPRLCRALRRSAKQNESGYSRCAAEMFLLDYAVRFEPVETAKMQLRRSLAATRTENVEAFTMRNCVLAAKLFIRCGEYETALGYLDAVQETAQRVGDKSCECAAWTEVCEIFLQLEQYETAAVYGRRAQKTDDSLKKDITAICAQRLLQLKMAYICVNTGKYEKATELLSHVGDHVEGILVPDLRALGGLVGTELTLRLAGARQAAVALEQAVAHETAGVSLAVVSLVQMGLARLAQEMQNKDLAARCLRRLHEQLPTCANPAIRKTAADLRVEWCKRWGDTQQLFDAYEAQYALCEKEVGDVRRIWGHSLDTQMRLQLLARENRRIRTNNEALRTISAHDELTGIPNRRRLNAEIERRWQKALYSDAFIGVIIFDVDRFKEINDMGGHLLGDELLRSVAQSLQDDSGVFYAARFGGDEFMAVCTGCNNSEIETYIKGVFRRMQKLGQTAFNDLPPVTLSAGFCNTPARLAEGITQLVSAADHALYEAKERRRNCFCGCDCLPSTTE